ASDVDGVENGTALRRSACGSASPTKSCSHSSTSQAQGPSMTLREQGPVQAGCPRTNLVVDHRAPTSRRRVAERRVQLPLEPENRRISRLEHGHLCRRHPLSFPVWDRGRYLRRCRAARLRPDSTPVRGRQVCGFRRINVELGWNAWFGFRRNRCLELVPKHHLPNAKPNGLRSSVAAPLMITTGLASPFAPPLKTSTLSSAVFEMKILPTSSTAMPVACTDRGPGPPTILTGATSPFDPGAYTLMNVSLET